MVKKLRRNKLQRSPKITQKTKNKVLAVTHPQKWSVRTVLSVCLHRHQTVGRKQNNIKVSKIWL